MNRGKNVFDAMGVLIGGLVVGVVGALVITISIIAVGSMIDIMSR